MKTKFLRSLPLLVSGLLLTHGAAQAQTATPSAGGRLAVVEIKNASLKDAINLVFRAAGLPLPIVDESASNYFIPDVVRTNIDWNDLARQLCASKNFKISRNPDGQYVIEPRVVPQFQNADGSFGFAEGFQGGGFPGAVPSNPFGGGAFGGGGGAFGGFGGQRMRTQGAPLIKPTVETQANFQFGRGGRGGRNRTGNQEPVNYTPIQIRHVYAGGIASLFGNTGVISTQQFTVPASASQQGGGGLGGRSGGGGGIGGGIGGGSIGGGSLGGGGGIGGGVSSFGGGGGGGFR